MSAYFDSGVLVKLYVTEPNSEEAVRRVQQAGGPLLFTPPQELELRNAIRLKAARKEITEAQLRKSLGQIKADFDAGFLKRPALDWTEVWGYAEKLSSRHARECLCRTMDTLHVAIASHLGARDFVSFDIRQRALAKKAGLRLKPND